MAVPPAPEITKEKAAALTLVNDKSLPSGALTPAAWEKIISAAHPELVIDYGRLAPNERYYKDEIARLLWQRKDGGPLGSFNPETMDLSLYASADYSTFVHELGHAFLTIYADLAARKDAPARVVEGMNAMLKELGVPSLEAWNAMPFNEQVAHHERIARSFEQYIFTGKAPSVQLQSLFASMAAWFKRVYRSLKAFVASNPEATLNPELSAVFDRMLATEADIETANNVRNYSAMFSSAVDAGMTADEFARYVALNEQQLEDSEAVLRARSIRDIRWLKSRRDAKIAAIQKETRELRAAMQKEVAAEVMAEPIRQAERYLRRGVVLNDAGMDVAPIGPNKLRIADVEALYPAEAVTPPPDWKSLGYGKYGMLAKDGVAPDEMAMRFGFASGTDLVDSLLALPKLKTEIDERTDLRMLETYGDLNSPEAVAQAADEAIHNEFRTRAVATELSALDREIGPVSVLIKAAKEYARGIIEGKTSRTLKPWSYAAAETRAGKEALRALRVGDRAKAAAEKRTELINHIATREAYDAEKAVKKIKDRLTKIASYNDEASAVKARDHATVQAVRALLSDHGIGQKGAAAKEYLKTLQRNDAEAYAMLADLMDVTGEAPKNWQDIKINDLKLFARAVEDMWYVAQRHKQFEVQGRLVAEEVIVNELYDAVASTNDLEKRIPGEGHAVTRMEELKMKLSAKVAALTRMEFLADTFDGQSTMGAWGRNVIGVIQDASAAMSLDKVRVLGDYYKLLKAIEPSLKTVEISAPEIGYVFGKAANGSGRSELLHALLHTGNESNMRKLLLGRGWATELEDGTLDTSNWDAFVARMKREGFLTKADYDFAQGVWDLLESMKPKAQQAHRAVYGKYFSEVTATPFTNEFGTYRGGYVPATADRNLVRKADEFKGIEDQKKAMVNAFPSPVKGFTKARSEAYAKPLKLDLSALGNHINQVLIFSHMAPAVYDVTRVVKNSKVADAIHRVAPGLVTHTIMPWLNRAATHETSERTSNLDSLMGFLRAGRSHAGTNTMLGNIANAIQQLTGIIPATIDVRGQYLRAALVRTLSSPSEVSEFIKGLSPYMATRLDNEASAMMYNVSEILINPNIYQSAVQWTARHAYFLQSAVDAAVTPTLWLGAFQQSQALHPELSELDHVHVADRLIRQTQGASGALDISSFEAGPPFMQLFTQFYGFFNMMSQFLHGRFVKTMASEMSLPAKYARAFYIVSIGFYAQAVAAELITLLFRGGPADDDHDGDLYDDWLAQLFLSAPFKFATAMVPWLGQAVVAASNSFNDKPYDDRISISPAVSTLEAVGKVGPDTYKALFEEGRPSRAVRDIGQLIGLFTGLPTGALARPVGYAADVATGHTKPTSPADAARGIITGTSSPESKR